MAEDDAVEDATMLKGGRVGGGVGGRERESGRGRVITGADDDDDEEDEEDAGEDTEGGDRRRMEISLSNALNLSNESLYRSSLDCCGCCCC